ncbi:aldehyde dehydrogenase family protein [Asanoa sp. WMMD1127]|uniref:aldehyde dehydrogenase family protein n=1 Tax=Asanoa sp. WMMD1127 TaxID=3016107 RepID=UPI0024176E0D|nr:aldehyde dehydrogenase family protein [Asanoa sp. WMMD1127]MDG4820527.1 aldehyde dehydrogenase family protein [Asanoa sp. WMMD1127]
MRLHHWIDGTPAAAATDATIDVVNPANGEIAGVIPAGTEADVDRAVAVAKAAFPAWSATEPNHRAEIVQRIGNGLDARRDQLAAAITAEMGAPAALARTAHIDFPTAVAESFADLAATFEWTKRIGNSQVVREPIGVVGAITPWNFPLQQVMSKIAPALIAGDTVVLKPSELAPLTAGILAEISKEAGLPPGVLNVVHGTGPVVGEAISAHPDIDMISFTGSTRAGKRIGAVAAQTVKRVALELGGKGANVILAGADLSSAVEVALGRAFVNGGQVCGSWPRLLVPADRHDEIVELAVEAARKYTVGDPNDPTTVIGPLATEAHRQKVDGYIRRGIEDGATLVFGGPGHPDGLTHGAYARPTIFADVDPYSVVAQEEIFGPVLTITRYADEDEAVAIANATAYGLTGGVFGPAHRALAVASRMRAGQIDVNGGHWNALAPFGGYKQSGNGREFGAMGLEEFLETKAIQLP